MPTRLPLQKFYEELVKTQRVLGTNHMAFGALRGAASIALRLMLKGQTNFVKMLWKFNKVYNAERQYSEHFREVKYQMTPPPAPAKSGKNLAANLYVHLPREGTVDASTVARLGAGF